MATVFKNLPGVRIEEVRLGAPPIIGVGTSTAGFVGMAPKNGTDDKSRFKDVLRLVTSADQFIADYFKDPNPADPAKPKDAVKSTVLSHAVLGFFKNGGTECYVLNVDAEDSTTVSKGIDRLAEKPEIDIVAAPVDEANLADRVIQNKLSEHAKTLANRFAILDPPKTSATIITDLKAGGGKRPNESIWAALYYPRIQVAPFLADDPKTPIFIGPSGHIAGLYAQVDGNRGVHKAAANVALAGALAVEQVVSDSDQDTLNKDGVDVIRLFGDGPVVWGARTLQQSEAALDSSFLYITSRRLATFVEQSLKSGLRFAVFEPNNLALRKTITRSVRGFLDGVWRDGALFGATADEAYYVRFPDNFNTDDDRNKGKLTLEIGLRPAPPAEFIIIRIGLLDRPANETA
jgi:uncharacterized protein